MRQWTFISCATSGFEGSASGVVGVGVELLPISRTSRRTRTYLRGAPSPRTSSLVGSLGPSIPRSPSLRPPGYLSEGGPDGRLPSRSTRPSLVLGNLAKVVVVLQLVKSTHKARATMHLAAPCLRSRPTQQHEASMPPATGSRGHQHATLNRNRNLVGPVC
jgi:hypothetical protein